MSLVDTVAKQIQTWGQPVTLKRRVGTTSTFTTATVPGKVHHYRPDELIGGIVQGDRRVTVAPSSLVGTDWEGLTPRKGDFVEIDGQQAAVQGCEVRYVAGEAARYEIWIRG